MADIIIHFLLFELFSSLFEPDLNLHLRIAGSLSRGLRYRLPVRYLFRGDYRLSKRNASACCKEEAWFYQDDVDRGMRQKVLDIVGPGKLGLRGQLLGRSL